MKGPAGFRGHKNASQGATRVKMTAACQDFYLAERECEAAKSREREASRTKIYNDAALKEKEKQRRRRLGEPPLKASKLDPASTQAL